MKSRLKKSVNKIFWLWDSSLLAVDTQQIGWAFTYSTTPPSGTIRLGWNLQWNCLELLYKCLKVSMRPNFPTVVISSGISLCSEWAPLQAIFGWFCALTTYWRQFCAGLRLLTASHWDKSVLILNANSDFSVQKKRVFVRISQFKLTMNFPKFCFGFFSEIEYVIPRWAFYRDFWAVLLLLQEILLCLLFLPLQLSFVFPSLFVKNCTCFLLAFWCYKSQNVCRHDL